MKVVLDTNVLVSGLLNPNGYPGVIIGLLLNKRITLCYDSRIIYEYEKVLSYPKFNFSEEEIISLIEYIKDQGEPVSVEPLGIKLKDPNDLVFLEVGVTSGAKFLVTGNVKHFPKKMNGLTVITPAQFIRDRYKA